LCLEQEQLVQRISTLRAQVVEAARAFQRADPLAQVSRLMSRPAGGSVPDFGSIRQDVASLLTALDRNYEGETALVLESVTTDIGVGD
jgi:hypothetical protein